MLTKLLHKSIGFIRNNATLREKAKELVLPLVASTREIDIPEITPLDIRFVNDHQPRLTLFVPSINQKHIFGGIATALSFFDNLAVHAKIKKRIITTDTMPDEQAKSAFQQYEFVSSTQDHQDRDVVIGFGDRYGKTIPIGKNEYFMATAWWTAFHAQAILHKQSEKFGRGTGKLVYFIQDYEPGFYPWSSRYALAESTYKSEIPTTAVFNSSMLHSFFINNRYTFHDEYEFEPVLNSRLAQGLKKEPLPVKKQQILIYGRPSVDRNAFSLIIAALKKWVLEKDNTQNWKLFSAGEDHVDVDLGRGMTLRSLGKLSLDGYIKMLKRSALGISLMVSPHPSYPPMEMAMFGMGVISNTFANKQLSQWHENIHSITLSIDHLAGALNELAQKFEENKQVFIDGKLKKENYMHPEIQFDFMDTLVKSLLEK